MDFSSDSANTGGKTGGIDRRWLAGQMMTAANVALASYGGIKMWQHRGDGTAHAKEEFNDGKWSLATAAGFGLGSAALAKYGQRDVPKQLQRLEEKLAEFLTDQGVPLDAEKWKVADATTRSGFGRKLEDFMYQHPTEISNAFTAVMSLGYFGSGISTLKSKPKQAAGKIGAGILLVTGALIGIFVKEKTPEQLERDKADGKADGAFGGIRQWAESKPLAAALIPYTLNNAAIAASGFEEMQEMRARGNHSYIFLYALAGTNFIANMLVGASSKKASGSETERTQAQNELMTHAREMLQAVPEPQRDAMIGATARYLSEQTELRLNDRQLGDIVNQLREQGMPHKLANPPQDFRARVSAPQPQAAGRG